MSDKTLSGAIEELKSAVWDGAEPLFDWLIDKPRLVMTIYWAAIMGMIVVIIWEWRID